MNHITTFNLKDRYVNIKYNNAVKNLNKNALILYLNLINIRDTNELEEEYFECSTKYIRVRLKFVGFDSSIGILDRDIKKHLKELKDSGLIEVKTKAYYNKKIKKYTDNKRYIKINNIDGIDLKKIKLYNFNRELKIQSIKLLLLLYSRINREDIMGSYISNEDIATELGIRQDSIKMYLKELETTRALVYDKVIVDGCRNIKIKE
jgi:biotin operon repressor